MQVKRILLLLGFAAFAGAVNVTAQSAKEPANMGDAKGFTSYTEFQVTSSSLGQVFEWNTSVGYNFNQHFGVDVGLPIYYASPSSTATSGSSSGVGAGNAYADLRIAYPNPALNYASKITLGAPTGNKDKGFSTGRATIDWNNHFDHAFGRFTPFGEAGLANTISDTRFFARPFTSLGFVSHFQGGMTIDFARVFQAGVSIYAVEPSGTQKIYSKLVGQQASPTTTVQTSAAATPAKKPFASTHITSGGSELDRDHGYTVFVRASPSDYVDLQVAYTRSVEYQLNTVSLSVGFNLGVLARRANRH